MSTYAQFWDECRPRVRMKVTRLHEGVYREPI